MVDHREPDSEHHSQPSQHGREHNLVGDDRGGRGQQSQPGDQDAQPSERVSAKATARSAVVNSCQSRPLARWWNANRRPAASPLRAQLPVGPPLPTGGLRISGSGWRGCAAIDRASMGQRQVIRRSSMGRVTDIDIPDQSGRRAVVTGASDGIGVVIARRLAAAGAEVILPVRNPEKGGRAADRIREVVLGADVKVHRLDLSSFESIATFADALLSEGRPIAVLVNNAGVMTPPSRQVTAEGFELQFGTNHLGHFALTARLLPLLRAGRAHVTHQVSIAARNGTINWYDLNSEHSYDGMRAYAQSKIAVGLFGRELQVRSDTEGWGITSNLSHPGVSPTNLLAAQPGMGRERPTAGYRVIRTLSRVGLLVGTVESAALPALMASTTAEHGGGLLYGPKGLGNVGGPPGLQELWAPLKNAADGRWLWDASEELVGLRVLA